MKQLFTLVSAALIAFSANAEISTVRNNNNISAPIKVENIKVSKKAPARMAKKSNKTLKASEASAFDTFLGEYVHSQWCLDPDSYNDWIGSSTGCQIKDNGDGTVTIENILGYGDIQATYDAENEVLLAAANQFLFESIYGNIQLTPFIINDDDEVEFVADDIVFYIEDNNRLMIENDGVVMAIADGLYAGLFVNGLYMFNQFDRVNATMTFNDFYNDEYTIGVAIDGSVENGYVDVYGFGDVSCITIEVDGETASVPEGQSIFFHNAYGMYYLYPIVEVNGSFTNVKSGAVEGTYDDQTQTFSLASCCGFCSEANSIYDVYYNPVITINVDESIVAIEQVKNSNHAATLYDLQGRMISKPVQGQPFIKDNSKMIVK